MNTWIALFLSLVLIIGGVHTLVTGDGGLAWGRFAVPVWAAWIMLPCGLCIGFISLRALLRGEGKEPEYTDEDIEKAKVKLEKIYIQEHGSRPEVPGEKPEAERSEERQEK